MTFNKIGKRRLSICAERLVARGKENDPKKALDKAHDLLSSVDNVRKQLKLEINNLITLVSQSRTCPFQNPMPIFNTYLEVSRKCLELANTGYEYDTFMRRQVGRHWVNKGILFLKKAQEYIKNVKVTNGEYDYINTQVCDLNTALSEKLKNI
ncbi:MAG: hypothetical protein WC501_02225 [Candidatus Micrarchaeia archaeon]